MSENSTCIVLSTDKIGSGPIHTVGRTIFYDVSGKSECIAVARGTKGDERKWATKMCKKQILRRGLSEYPNEVIDATNLSADKE